MSILLLLLFFPITYVSEANPFSIYALVAFSNEINTWYLLLCRWHKKDAIREFSQQGDKHCYNEVTGSLIKRNQIFVLLYNTEH